MKRRLVFVGAVFVLGVGFALSPPGAAIVRKRVLAWRVERADELLRGSGAAADVQLLVLAAKEPEILDGLLELARSPDSSPEMRERAIRVLGLRAADGDDAALDVLLELLDAAERSIRSAASEAVARLALGDRPRAPLQRVVDAACAGRLTQDGLRTLAHGVFRKADGAGHALRLVSESPLGWAWLGSVPWTFGSVARPIRAIDAAVGAGRLDVEDAAMRVRSLAMRTRVGASRGWHDRVADAVRTRDSTALEALLAEIE